MDRGTLTLRNKRRTLMIKIKNRCCYTVTLILCGTLFLTGLTGCKSTVSDRWIAGSKGRGGCGVIRGENIRTEVEERYR